MPHRTSVSRRAFLRVGASGAVGLALPELVARRAAAALPVTELYAPFDIGATADRVLGAEIRDALNRPTRLNGGTPIDVPFRNA